MRRTVSGRDPVANLIELLDRGSPIAALDALIGSLDPKPVEISLAETAIGIDANVFLRITSDTNAELIIDYLSGVHKAPLILPGQAIQEFWNNQHEVYSTIAKPIRSNFNNLKQSIERLKDEGDLDNLVEKFEALIDQFESDQGGVYEPANVAKTAKLLSTLNERASVPFIQRSLLNQIAEQRKRSKTPPGFKDAGDGDFLIWVDFLLGLRNCQLDGRNFTKAVLVTNDTKRDWSRNGQAHPILVAEAKSFLGLPFETWTLKQLVTEIQKATSEQNEEGR